MTRLVVFCCSTDFDDCCCWLFFLCSSVSLFFVLGTTELLTVTFDTFLFFIDLLYTAWFSPPGFFSGVFLVGFLFSRRPNGLCVRCFVCAYVSGFRVSLFGSGFGRLAVWFGSSPPSPSPLPPLCCLLVLCVLHLALACIQPGDLSPAMAPASSGPPPRASVLTRLLLGDVGWTRGGVGRKGDRGHCDPAQV